METIHIDDAIATGFITFVKGRMEIIVTEYSVETEKPVDVEFYIRGEVRKHTGGSFITILDGANVWE